MIFRNKTVDQLSKNKPHPNKIFIITVLILLTLITDYYVNNFRYTIKAISYVGYFSYMLKNNDNFFPRGVLSAKGKDQQSLWETIKSKYKHYSQDFSGFNSDIGVVKTDKSKFLMRLYGVSNNVAFNNDDKKLEFKKLVQQELLKLGYQEIKPTEKLYDITFINSPSIETIFYKGNQVFLVAKETVKTCQEYTLAPDGYCPITVSYIKNIKDHVNRGVRVLNKIIDDSQGIFNLHEEQNTIIFTNGDKVDNYKILEFKTPTNQYVALLKKQGFKLKQIWFGDHMSNNIETITTDSISKYIECVYSGYLTGITPGWGCGKYKK